jgi:hypothetical protein
MLNSITWQSFSLILLAPIAVYYIVSVVIFYCADVRAYIISRISHPTISQRPQAASGDVVQPEFSFPDLMGNVKTDVVIEEIPASVSADEIFFEQDDDQIPEVFLPLIQKASANDSLLIGSVADLLHELKTLFKMLREYNSSKEEGCNLLSSLLTKYPHLSESSFKDSITEYTCDLFRKELSFELQYQEVTKLWRTESVP